MADPQYAVIFQGQIADGADPAAVRANLGKLFKADSERVEKMFSGQKVIIKRGLDVDSAAKYKAVLLKAGALVAVVDMAAKTPAEAKPAEPASPQPNVAPAPAAESVVSEAAPAATSVETAPTTRVPTGNAPQTVPAGFAGADAPPDALNTTMAEPGETLAESQHAEAPAIAIDHLSMAEAGVVLSEHEPAPEPEYDLSSMSLDPPGVTLAESVTITPPEFDTSNMSLDEVP
jgi:hypothetical protein